MEVKEAIEFLESMTPGELIYTKDEESYSEYKLQIDNFNGVINLLKSLEVYKRAFNAIKAKAYNLTKDEKIDYAMVKRVENFFMQRRGKYGS